MFNFLRFKDKGFFKLILLFIISSLCVLLISISCRIISSGSEEEGEQASEEQVEAVESELTEEEKKDIKIELWDCLEPKGRLALMESIESFTLENNYIEIDTEHFRSQEELEDKFEAASLAGAGPELILLNFDGVQRLAPENVIKEIEAETAEALDYSLLLDGLVEISEYNGRKYIIPFRSYDFLVFFYNKDIVEKVPERFEDLISYCKEVNNYVEGVYGFMLNSNEADWIIPFIGGYGDWIVEYNYSSLTLENEATEKTMEFLNYIYNEEEILPRNVEYSEINEAFKSGKVHMIIDSISLLGEYEEAGINYGIAQIPRVWEGSSNPTPLISGTGFMINANCYGSELEAVNEFLKFILSEEEQIGWTSGTDTFPVLKNIDRNDAIRSDSIVYNAFQQAKLCRGKPYEELIMVIRDAIRDNAKSVISGDILPADAALKIQEDALRLRSGSIAVDETEEEETAGEIEESGETE
ncbi:MAG: hypothetical protein AVO38_00035 [delta proteobacterium ML8_D]|jgi:maltose-binding protein MalE|nr:MAG: hypothetical protein AVO38_00035 [delta proteobacterium ML8_D]